MFTIRWLELFVLFYGLPIAIALTRASGIGLSPLPVLWVAALVCFVFLWRSKSEASTPRHNFDAFRAGLPGVLLRVAVGSVILLGIAAIFIPESLFAFPRRAPVVWAIIMVAYPLLSVVPQGIVFRQWFLKRYRALLGNGLWMLLVAAITFGFAHIAFGNWIAPLLTTLGGVIFMRTFMKSRSALLANLEHALFGDIVFTLGYGQWLYAGAS